jgi:archaeal flagellin N-terminal-like domain
MQTIKYRNKRKAVSPIIATLILIVITVAAGVIIYYFVSGYLSSTTSSATNQETYVITSVIYYKTSTNYFLNATVYNSGAASINITNAKVLNPTGSVVAHGTVIKNGLVLPGQTVVINIQLNNTLIKGTVYTLVTTTVQGTQQTFTFKA